MLVAVSKGKMMTIPLSKDVISWWSRLSGLRVFRAATSDLPAYAPKWPRRMNRTLIVCLIVLFAGTWTGVPRAADVYSDRVAASVNGDVILESEVRECKQPFVRKSFSLPLGIVPPGKVPTEKEILDELVVTHLLEQDAVKKGIQINEQGLNSSIEALQKRNNLTPDRFVQYLAANGLNYADFRRLLKRQMILSAVVAREMQQRLNLSEEGAQKYFKENKGKIDEQFRELVDRVNPPAPQDEPKPEIPTHKEVYVGGRLHLRQIVLKPPEGRNRQAQEKFVGLVKQVYQEHQMGADFAQLARKYSKDSSALRGGDLGVMDFKDMQPGMQKVVEHLKVGSLSQPLPLGKEGLVILYLADATNRQLKKVPIPEKERKQLEKELQELQERRDAERKRAEAEREARREKAEPEKEQTDSSGKKKAEKDPGILTGEEKKEYDKVRGKVIEIIKNKGIETKMRDWIEELKKNSIIETKL
jgi:peptidyl-prolyl cis-trans isomerase SurA